MFVANIPLLGLCTAALFLLLVECSPLPGTVSDIDIRLLFPSGYKFTLLDLALSGERRLPIFSASVFLIIQPQSNNAAASGSSSKSLASQNMVFSTTRAQKARTPGIGSDGPSGTGSLSSQNGQRLSRSELVFAEITDHGSPLHLQSRPLLDSPYYVHLPLLKSEKLPLELSYRESHPNDPQITTQYTNPALELRYEPENYKRPGNLNFDPPYYDQDRDISNWPEDYLSLLRSYIEQFWPSRSTTSTTSTGSGTRGAKRTRRAVETLARVFTRLQSLGKRTILPEVNPAYATLSKAFQELISNQPVDKLLCFYLHPQCLLPFQASFNAAQRAEFFRYMYKIRNPASWFIASGASEIRVNDCPAVGTWPAFNLTLALS